MSLCAQMPSLLSSLWVIGSFITKQEKKKFFYSFWAFVITLLMQYMNPVFADNPRGLTVDSDKSDEVKWGDEIHFICLAFIQSD